MGFMTKLLILLPFLVLMPVRVEPIRLCEEQDLLGNHTNCIHADGSMSICEVPYGVCCYDRPGCCPMGFKCSENSCYKLLYNAGSSGCRKKNVCPDKTQCQVDSTCCSVRPEGHGCCPLENAVCCPDQIHCCPADTICSEESNMCFQVNWNEVDETRYIRNGKIIGIHGAISYV